MMRRFGIFNLLCVSFWAAAMLISSPLQSADLVVDRVTVRLGGIYEYDSIRVVNGGIIVVPPYDGRDKTSTGNLVLKAEAIYVDETSTITAMGAGYQTVRCGNGQGPTPAAGGKGGCAVRDSGGGGAHFGRGGRGTKDCFVVAPRESCQFPQEWEEDCINSLDPSMTHCTNTSNCWNFDGLPPVSGVPYWHTIYDVEFGASGGDKGCRDGDGFGGQPNVAGAGGGRIVLVAVTDAGTGTIDIRGTVNADGRRGCGTGNDSAGGGAGGTVVIIGNQVSIGPRARVSAAGGMGGDTQGLAGSPDCPPPAQQGGVCDDCGGGGGGGLISILGDHFSIAPTAFFSVDGGLGGVCSMCRGEAGGGAGELQLYGEYGEEVCDGYDNDFDSLIDEDLPALPCGLPSCVGGVPQDCPPTPECMGPVTDTRPRFLVIIDTSASMLTDLAGRPTFGDGSVGHVGIDSNLDGYEGNDSRLYLAKEATSLIISAYPEVDWAIARYHQDSKVDQSCQLAHWVECRGMCCSYDDPRNNTPPAASPLCTLDTGATGGVVVQVTSPGEECINYSGTCGLPRRGADIVAGFGSSVAQYLMWMDHRETNFIPDETPGDYCDFDSGGDCELRGTGPAPIAGALQAAEDFLEGVIGCDRAAPCRRYGVILVTDGTERCGGDPVSAASDLYSNLDVEVHVVGFSVLPEEVAHLNAIGMAGSGGARGAYLVGNEVELANTLAAIVATSFVQERCNGTDDDCDGLVDEDFADLGLPCDDGALGECRGRGVMVCAPAGDATLCEITTPGRPPSLEICNGLDDDCDGGIDEDFVCHEVCVPDPPEVCDGEDNDCDGALDEEDPQLGALCGVTEEGPCRMGNLACIAGRLVCTGNVDPREEICNCEDEDCDAQLDDGAPCPEEMACIECACRERCSPWQEFNCPAGYACKQRGEEWYCVPTPCLYCVPGEICVNEECVNPCEGVACLPNETCIGGVCYDCNTLGCREEGEICLGGECRPDPCAGIDCGENHNCVLGECIPTCRDDECPEGESCDPQGACRPDPCAGVDCPAGRVCRDGTCHADPCSLVSCGRGKVCIGGDCIYDLCAGVDCAPGFVCKMVAEGTPVCVYPVAPPVLQPDGADVAPRSVAGTGGAGCSCTIVGGEPESGGADGRSGPALGFLTLIVLALLAAIWWQACGVATSFRGRLLLLFALLFFLPGCHMDSYDLPFDAPQEAGPGERIEDRGEEEEGEEEDGPFICYPIGPDDNCNELDDDCNGVVDDNFDKMNDPENCGRCAVRCVGVQEIYGCVEGRCVFRSCAPGFEDLDPVAAGCEYQCPVYPPTEEECNGIDDDCDGERDETEDLLPPPQGMCRDVAGTPCEGVEVVCDVRGNPPVPTWYCNYSPEVEFDPSLPSGIFMQETLCDGLDGDCDGVVDDPFIDLGLECDNGLQGACRDVGVRVCDPANPRATVCDLTAPPDPVPGSPSPEICNGVDDDCDGVVDNTEGESRVIDDMVEIERGGLHFWIYRYEASRPDATSSSQGRSTARACSRAGVLPWTIVSFEEAEAACAASGKRLCTAAEYTEACSGGLGRLFPYGDTYAPTACNGADLDGIPGGENDDILLPSGDPLLRGCVGPYAVYDLSGNAREWTNDIRGDSGPPNYIPIAVTRGGSYFTPRSGLQCDFLLSRAIVTARLPSLGFRCCSDSPP